MNDTFRCYYDDGTILEQSECPTTSPNGSPLINTEYEIIQDALSTPTCGIICLFVVLAAVHIMSKHH